MKKTLALLIIGLFVSVALLNGVSATTTDEKATNHGPFYFGSKPLERYEQPGFICGFYTEIELSSSTSVRALYSPHLLFGWDYSSNPFWFPLQIGVFASKVKFYSFNLTFIGFFSGTEPGFICGFVDGMCYFTHP